MESMGRYFIWQVLLFTSRLFAYFMKLNNVFVRCDECLRVEWRHFLRLSVWRVKSLMLTAVH